MATYKNELYGLPDRGWEWNRWPIHLHRTWHFEQKKQYVFCYPNFSPRYPSRWLGCLMTRMTWLVLPKSMSCLFLWPCHCSAQLPTPLQRSGKVSPDPEDKSKPGWHTHLQGTHAVMCRFNSVALCLDWKHLFSCTAVARNTAHHRKLYRTELPVKTPRFNRVEQLATPVCFPISY